MVALSGVAELRLHLGASMSLVIVLTCINFMSLPKMAHSPYVGPSLLNDKLYDDPPLPVDARRGNFLAAREAEMQQPWPPASAVAGAMAATGPPAKAFVDGAPHVEQLSVEQVPLAHAAEAAPPDVGMVALRQVLGVWWGAWPLRSARWGGSG